MSTCSRKSGEYQSLDGCYRKKDKGCSDGDYFWFRRGANGAVAADAGDTV